MSRLGLSKPWPVLGVIMVVGLVARIVISIRHGDNDVSYYEYMTIAQNLLDGNGYSFDEWGRAPLQPTSFLPPLYVYWCALFMAFLDGHYLWMYIAQAVVAVSGCIPAWLIGRKLFSETAGIGCALAYSLYPEFVFTHSRAVSEFLYLVSALWILYLYFEIKDRLKSRLRWLSLATVLGVISGVAVLIKESASVLVLAALLGLSITSNKLYQATGFSVLRFRFSAFKPVVLIAGVALLVLSPWMIRNLLVQGEFIPLRTGYGVTFWLANHPGSSGTAYTEDGIPILPMMDSTYLAQIGAALPADEQDRDRVYRYEGKRFVSEHTGDYLLLCLRRLGYFLWFDETHPIARRVEYRISFIALIILAVPGIIWAARRRLMDGVFVWATLGYVAMYVPVIVLPRYRIIPVLFLVLFAGLALSLVWTRTRSYIQHYK